MLNVKSKKLSEMWEELSALLTLHYEELATDKEVMELNPMKESYEKLESLNIYHSIFLYDDDKLIGYSGGMVTPALHYASLRYFQNDVLYLLPEYRSKEIGLFLVQETEQLASDLGSDIIFLHAKEDTALDRLAPKLGYKLQEHVYSKRL